MRERIQSVKVVIISLRLLVGFYIFIPTADAGLHMLLPQWGRRHTAHGADSRHTPHLLDTNAGIDICHVHLRDTLLAHHARMRRVVAGGGRILDLRRMLIHVCWRLLAHILPGYTAHVGNGCTLCRCVFIALILLIQGYCRWFFFNTSLLKTIGPFSACASMAMLEMLTEVIGTEEFLRLIALAKFVGHVQVTGSIIPVRCWLVAKFLTAIAASVICRGYGFWLTRYGGSTWKLRGGKKSRNIIRSEDGAGPGMATEMQGILVAFHFILILEAISTVCTTILLLSLMIPATLG